MQAIIEDQQASDLTIVDYCRENQISTTTFYAVRKKLGLISCHLVRSKITQQVEFISQSAGIELFIGQAKVALPSTTSATYLGQVLRELA